MQRKEVPILFERIMLQDPKGKVFYHDDPNSMAWSVSSDHFSLEPRIFDAIRVRAQLEPGEQLRISANQPDLSKFIKYERVPRPGVGGGRGKTRRGKNSLRKSKTKRRYGRR